MSKKLGYSPVSIFAALCGSVASIAAKSYPATALASAGVGTAASAIAGGIELNDEEQSVKEHLQEAVETAWNNLRVEYRIPDQCMDELQKEIMGENTSVDEFINNMQRDNLDLNP